MLRSLVAAMSTSTWRFIALGSIGFLTGCGGSAGSPAAPAQTDLVVAAILPTSGPPSGGTLVSVSGTGFEPSVTVMFDGTAATDVRVISSTLLTAIAPAHAVGFADVVVANSDRHQSILRPGYRYLDPFDTCVGWQCDIVPLNRR
jgi:hypothetical protein